MKFIGKKVLLIAAMVAIVGFGTYRLGTKIFGAQQFRFSLDQKLSSSMHKAIKDAVYESYSSSFASLCDLIRKVCPALEQISIERRANNKLYIGVQSMEPYVRIESLKPVRVDPSTKLRINSAEPLVPSESRGGMETSPLALARSIEVNGEKDIDSKVLTTSGVVFNKSCFNNEIIKPLPVITQKNEFGKATITDEFKQWLLRLDPSVFASYDIVWHDDFSIELHDKHTNQQTILCSVSTAPDKSLRELCQRIIEEKIICAQGTARKYLYTADIRFEKQIIICSHKGGACHG